MNEKDYQRKKNKYLPKIHACAGQGVFRRSFSLAEKRVLVTKDSIFAATTSRTMINSKNNDVKSIKSGKGTHGTGKQAAEKKPPSGKFHWFRKFSRSASEKNSEKARDTKQTESSTSGNLHVDTLTASTSGGDCNISGESKSKSADENNVSDTLRSYWKSMLHNI